VVFHALFRQGLKVCEEFPNRFRSFFLTGSANTGAAMIPFSKLTWHAAVAGRWAARILGTLMVLFLLAMACGEGLPRFSQMTGREQVYSLGMGSLFLGLILAWRWEGWGGLLSVFGWGFLAVLAGRPPWGWVLSIPAAVGLLHLLCWWRLRGPAPPSGPADSAKSGRGRMLFTVLWAILAAFLLLCANEMFGQPPLMTRTGPPPAEMVGTWQASLTTVSRQPLPNEIPVALTVGPDGSVLGSIGSATLTNGQFVRNRSWFGRLMNWRTEYMIQGTLSQVVESYGGTAGDRFSAPLQPRGAELHGALFLSHPGAPKPLGLNLKRR
jgi:hypothetical protein